MKKKFDFRISVLPPLVVFVVIVAVWQILVRVLQVPITILPAPSDVVKALFEFWPLLWPHYWETIWTLLVGVIISFPIAILVAAVLSQFFVAEKAFSPILIVMVTTPMITLVPIFMLLWGYDSWVKLICVMFQAIPVIALNSYTGFNKIEKQKLDLMRAFGASKLQTFIKCVFPNALPQVFTGAKLGCVFGTIALIAAEMNGFDVGIGSRATYYAALIRVDIVLACVLLIAILGIVLFSLVSALERKLVVWKNL